MGSGQSRQEGSFSIDPSGSINRRDSFSSSFDSNLSSEQNNQPQQTGQSSQTQILDLPEPQPYDTILNSTDNQSSPADTDGRMLTLEEADEITSRLKRKYKPNSGEMAGKQNSVFEEVERNLSECYATNKGQPLNCSKIFQQYKNYVHESRNQLLNKSLASTKGTLFTTLVMIITCLLLHITAVACYGAMSIDLGSEWMKVGLVAPSVQMDIVLNAQSQRKTPMAIAFSNGERFIGDTALDVASKYPEKAFTHFLDLIGKTTLDHESIKHYKQRFPYANITSTSNYAPNAPTQTNSTPTNTKPSSSIIILNHPEGLQFTPLELLAMMIQHAHDQVINRLNSNELDINDIVITVPPFFNPTERRVVVEAAKLAGLNVLRLTDVNSAFALSYGIFRHLDYLPVSLEDTSNRTSILFFDQGASHTSATLADYHLVEQIDPVTGLSKNESLPTITIRGQVYDRYLGGFDMQLKLRDHLIRTFAKGAKIEAEKIFKRGRSAAKLLKESGRVKMVLSVNTEHVARVENVINDIDLKQPITRQEYEELNQEYLSKRIIQLLDQLYELPEISRDDRLESVIIVGGNTRTPKIQQVLMDYFKLDVLGKSINADEGAALAALYQAASLGRGFRVKKFLLEAPTTETSSLIYSDAEVRYMGDKLAKLREEDAIRLQRLSLRNSLESLLSEAREKSIEQGLKDAITETYNWLEDGPFEEKENVTLLAEKFNAIYMLIHPKPPPTLPPSRHNFGDSSDPSRCLALPFLSIISDQCPLRH